MGAPYIYDISRLRVKGLGNKSNELYYHLHHDLQHILWLSEHFLSESELQGVSVHYCHFQLNGALATANLVI